VLWGCLFTERKQEWNYAGKGKTEASEMFPVVTMMLQMLHGL
jgi:hypothetical protein